MLTIYKGSVQEVKKAMKEASKEATVLRRTLEKEAKKRGAFSLKKKEYIAKIDACDRVSAFMVVSKFIPVWVDVPGGQILMNYLMLKEYGKRLKGFHVRGYMTYDEVGRKMVFEYFKGKQKGRLELYELPQDIFNLGNVVPKARFDDFVNIDALEGVM